MIPSPACESYGAPNEDTYHLYCVCPAYSVPRQALTQELDRVLPNETLQNNLHVEKALLFGLNSLDHGNNVKLFDALHVFINSSARF